MAISPWRLNLRPASYNGVEFHIEVESRNGGRRKALHEFPKKSIPYLEDMGRKARRFNVAAYLIGPDYESNRDALIAQLEGESNGQLIHPTYQDVDLVGVETYNVTERREQGGYCVFEITFTEAGQDVSGQIAADTQGAVSGAVDGAVPNASSFNGNDFSGSKDITALA